MKPAERPPNFKLLKPEPQHVHACPKCGQAMRKGVVRVWQESPSAGSELGEVVIATVGKVLSKAGSVMGGADPQLEFVGSGAEPIRVVRSGCVQTSFRCDCGVVAIFPVEFPVGAEEESCEPRGFDLGG